MHCPDQVQCDCLQACSLLLGLCTWYRFPYVLCGKLCHRGNPKSLREKHHRQTSLAGKLHIALNWSQPIREPALVNHHACPVSQTLSLLHLQ